MWIDFTIGQLVLWHWWDHVESLWIFAEMYTCESPTQCYVYLYTHHLWSQSGWSGKIEVSWVRSHMWSPHFPQKSDEKGCKNSGECKVYGRFMALQQAYRSNMHATQQPSVYITLISQHLQKFMELTVSVLNKLSSGLENLSLYAHEWPDQGFASCCGRW